MDAARVLTVDRGNTTLDCALGAAGTAVRARFEPSEDALVAFVGDRILDAVVAANVVVGGLSELESFCSARRVPLLRAGTELACPLRTGYTRSESLGVDRWVGAIAARERHGAAIVVDAGSAVTVDAVDGERFFAGVIAPGLGAASEGLARRAPGLPRADFDAAPPELPTRSPEEAVTAGALLGFVALVDGLVARVRAAAGLVGAVVVLTGGDADRVLVHSKTSFVHEPELVHDGLRWLLRHHVSSS